MVNIIYDIFKKRAIFFTNWHNDITFLIFLADILMMQIFLVKVQPKYNVCLLLPTWPWDNSIIALTKCKVNNSYNKSLLYTTVTVLCIHNRKLF